MGNAQAGDARSDGSSSATGGTSSSAQTLSSNQANTLNNQIGFTPTNTNYANVSPVLNISMTQNDSSSGRVGGFSSSTNSNPYFDTTSSFGSGQTSGSQSSSPRTTAAGGITPWADASLLPKGDVGYLSPAVPQYDLISPFTAGLGSAGAAYLMGSSPLMGATIGAASQFIGKSASSYLSSSIAGDPNAAFSPVAEFALTAGASTAISYFVLRDDLLTCAIISVAGSATGTLTGRLL